MLKKFFNDTDDTKIVTDIANPDEAVAAGATLMAGILAGQTNTSTTCIVNDVVPLPVGIGLAGGKFGSLI